MFIQTISSIIPWKNEKKLRILFFAQFNLKKVKLRCFMIVHYRGQKYYWARSLAYQITPNWNSKMISLSGQGGFLFKRIRYFWFDYTWLSGCIQFHWFDMRTLFYHRIGAKQNANVRRLFQREKSHWKKILRIVESS